MADTPSDDGTSKSDEARTSQKAAKKQQKPTTNHTESTDTPQIVVGIGASAGGLEALNNLFEALPANTGMAFVVVMHLGPTHTSQLPALLKSRTAMPASEIADDMPLHANHIYVIPPGHNIGLHKGKFHLFPIKEERAPHLPIDYFLQSLAQDRGSQAVGVILSGSGSDGTLGLRTIKTEGGVTFAQEQQTALYEAMPRSAIESGYVDRILSPRQIAETLAQLSVQDLAQLDKTEEVIAKSTSLDKIFFLLRQHTGHDFEHYKRSTIVRRIKRRMLLHRLAKLEEYVKYLQGNRAEIDQLFDDLLINVTSFFRDPETFAALEQKVFPHILKDLPPKEPVRIWIPGCSTGEEAYSVAMSLVDYLAREESIQPIQIFATDIDEKAIEKARTAIYPESSIAGIGARRLRKFFTKVPNGYQITKQIRDLCVFAEQNLANDPPFSRLDLVVCRNVLIYLDSVLQKKILAILHFALKVGGILVLGTSESVSNQNNLFSCLDKKNKIYTKKSVPHHMPREFALPTVSEPRLAERPASGGTRPRDVQREAEVFLVSNYGPPGVIIDQQMTIMGFLGNTGPFIAPAPGALTNKLLKMVNPSLTIELRATVSQAIKENADVRRENAGYRDDEGRERKVNIVVTPLQRAEAAERFFLVLFEPAEKAAIPSTTPTKAKALPSSETDTNSKIAQLEDELGKTEQEMRALINEHMTTNEELQTANEEIQSANEELQSTNEELESAKEELQSTNEELATVNDELQVRNTELAQANNDLNNLLNSVNLPILMLNNDLRIRHFTPAAKALLNVIDSDMGRPITDLRLNLELPNLERTLLGVIEDVSPASLETRDTSGRYYSVEIRAYRTADNRIAGAVLTFLDITDIKQDPEQTQRLAAVVRDSNDAITLQDLDGHIHAWNRGAEKIYGYKESEALQMTVLDLIPGELREETETLYGQFRRGELRHSLETRRRTKSGEVLDISLTISPLYDTAGRLTGIATTERDITELKHNLEKARRLAAVVEDSSDAIMVVDLQGQIRAWNRRAYEQYAYTESEALSMNFRTLLPPEAQADYNKIVDRVKTHQRVEPFRTKRKDKDGNIIDVWVTVTALRTDKTPDRMAITEREILD